MLKIQETDISRLTATNHLHSVSVNKKIHKTGQAPFNHNTRDHLLKSKTTELLVHQLNNNYLFNSKTDLKVMEANTVAVNMVEHLQLNFSRDSEKEWLLEVLEVSLD